jgi:glycosyltransferase involved in cell wall biosynthesis
MTKKTSFSVVVPVYNEQEAITETLDKLKNECQKLSLNYDFEIIVVNDGSTDQTRQILEKISGIIKIDHPYNLGYGAALKTGIKRAKSDWILIIDADGTYPIESIPHLLPNINNYDMVIGARTGANVNIPKLRKPGKFIVNWLANFLTGRKIQDINSGLRLFRKSIALEFFHLFPSRFSFTITLTLACLTNDYTVKYIPINYHQRQGKSTLGPKDFTDFLTLIFRIIMYFNPLKFFLWPGFTIIALGFIYSIATLIIQHNIADGAVMMILSGLQIILIGLVADLIVKSRQ